MLRQPTATGGARRGRRLLAGLAALAALAALIGGLPLLLRYASDVLLPSGWTPLADLPDARTSPDDGSLLAQAILAAGWVTWAALDIVVVWEIVRRLLRRPPAAGGRLLTPQGIAGWLVAAVAALAATTANAAQAAPAAVVATGDLHPDESRSISPAGQEDSTGPVLHLVQRGEALLDLQERYSVPWQRIAEANYDREQADGQRLQRGHTLIHAGWQLRIPTTATAATARPAASESPTVCAGEHVLRIGDDSYTYLVQHDDSLWAIAELCLGDGARWPDIWVLNQGRRFPDVGGSLHSPDLIYPGWDLHLPADAVPPPQAEPAEPSPPAEPAEPEPTPPAPAGSPRPTAPATLTPSTPTNPEPGTAAPAPSPTAPAEAGAGQPPPAPPGQPDGPAGQQDPDDRSPAGAALPVTAALATAGLLTALILARLRHHRGRRQQHRRHGRRLAEPDPAVETATRVAAQPADVARLDHALRALAAALPGITPAQLPDIVAVWLDSGTVHLLLAAPCPNPPPPYVAAAGDMTWTLPADADLPEPSGQLAPLPTLATIASHPDGQHLLIDVERAGLLTITGDPARRSDLLRYLAAEAATADWIDDGEVVLAGFTAHETAQLTALNEERVRGGASVEEAVARVQRRATANQAALADAGCGNAFSGRINDIAADAWMPHLLIIADPQADLAELGHSLHHGPRSAVAVVAAANQPGAWNINIDPDGRISVDWLSITETYAAALPADQLARLAPMLRTARSLLPPDQADFDEPVPPAVEQEPWAQGTDMHGHLLAEPDSDDGPSLGDERAAADEPVPADHEPAEPATARADNSQALAPDSEEQHATDPWPAVAQPPTQPEPPDPPPVPATAAPTTADDRLPDQPTAADPAERSPAVNSHAADDPTGPDEPANTAGPGGSISRLLPTFAAPAGHPPPPTTVAPQATRRHRATSDPDLDADLTDWHTPTPDHARPCIGILGPVEIGASGEPPADRHRFYAEIIVYLAQRGRRGAVPDELDEAIWPGGVAFSSRRVAMSKIRSWLGESRDGEQWLPPGLGGDRTYRINDSYLFDWHLFRRLRTRAEARGAAGTSDLRQALELVRGVPLDGADRPYHTGKRNPYAWLADSNIPPHHLASAIVDTAHQLVDLSLAAGDTATARWAVEKAWAADPDRTDDHPWVDLMRIHHADGHTSELRTLLTHLMETRAVEVPEELNPHTFQAINALSSDLLRVVA